MDRRKIVVTAGVLAIVAFFAGAWYYQSQPETSRSLTPASAKSSAPTATRASLPAPYIRPHTPRLGPSNAPVTISEFFDPACEACRAFHPIVKKIIDAFPGKVRVAVRYTPFHGPSKEAIAILEAARKQGRFVPVLEALLEKQPAWAPHGRPGQSPWEFVSGTGLDIDRAKIDARHPSVTAVIDQDFADVKALGVRQTPTFFVDGQPLQRFSAQGLYDLVKQRVAGL